MELFLREKWIQIKDYYCHLLKDKKILLINYLIALKIILIIVIISFILRTQAINFVNDNKNNSTSNSGTYKVVLNPGISFGFFDKNTGLVYFLQIVPVMISLLLMLHSRKYLFTIGIAMVFASGFCNLLDRIITEEFAYKIGNHTMEINNKHYGINTVVDYWQFNNTIINFPDIFISVGIGWVILYSLFNSYYESKTKKSNLKSIDQQSN